MKLLLVAVSINGLKGLKLKTSSVVSWPDICEFYANIRWNLINFPFSWTFFFHAAIFLSKLAS